MQFLVFSQVGLGWIASKNVVQKEYFFGFSEWNKEKTEEDILLHFCCEKEEKPLSLEIF